MPIRLTGAEYYASLPRALAGAGALFHDADGRVLLVRPVYRDDTWLLPGGGMEAGEYPWQTARREVAEELGLELRPGRLLAVDWVPPQPDGRPTQVTFVFDGGTLSERQAGTDLRLQAEELVDWRMCPAHEADRLLVPHLARRVRACTDAVRTGQTTYLQHGYPFPP